MVDLTRIKDLPTNTTPNPNQYVPTDLASTQKLTIQDLVDIGSPLASQAEAEAGTQATNRMTPLTTKQAIDALGVPSSAIGVTIQAYSNSLATLSALTPGAAGQSILVGALSADVRNFLDTAPYVATRTAAKALDTTKETTFILTETGREGIFNWRAGDYSSQIAADTAEGLYIKATAIAATAGAWVRFHDGGIEPKWFGGIGDGNAIDTLPFISCASACMTSGQTMLLGSYSWRVKDAQRAGYTADGQRLVVLLDGQKLTIAGASAKIIFDGNDYTQYATMFRLKNGAVLNISGVEYDYANLPFAQGKCVSKTATAARFKVDVAATGVPNFTSIRRLATYSPTEKRMLIKVLEQDQGANRRSFVLVDAPNNIWEVSFANAADTPALANVVVGDTCVMYAETNGNFFVYGEDSSLFMSDCMISTTAGMGVGGVRYRDCVIDGKGIALKNDRLIATTSDGYHIAGIERQAIFTPDIIEGTSDDAGNLNNPAAFVYSTALAAPYNDGKTFAIGGTVSLGGINLVAGDILYRITSTGLQVALPGVIESVITTSPASTSIPYIRMTQAIPGDLKGSLEFPADPGITPISCQRYNPKNAIFAPKIVARCLRGVLIRGENPTILGEYRDIGGPAVDASTTWGAYREGPVSAGINIDIRAIRCGLLVNQVPAVISISAGDLAGTGTAATGAIVVANVNALVQDCPIRPLSVVSVSRVTGRMIESGNNYNANPSAPVPAAAGYFQQCNDVMMEWFHLGDPDVILHFDNCLRVDLPASNSRVVYSTSGTTTLRTSMQNFTVRDGGNTGGAGGAISFMSNFGGWGDLAMSQWKGELAQYVAGEQQGGALLRVRPTGVAGQAWKDAMRVWPNGETFIYTMPVYASEAAALAGGLTAGKLYKSSDGIMRVKL